MQPRDIAIAIVWVFFIAVAFHHGIVNGHIHNPPRCATPCPPIHIWLFVPPFLFIVSSVGVLLLKDHLNGGIRTEFHKRLRLTALVMVTLLIIGGVGLVSTYANHQNSYAYFGATVALSSGLGLLIAYFLSRRFPPRL